ncbi:hypothetical protein Sfulv_01050 [Streptomyces fulvorobeus]|uniref:Uncharacterized protein n=1 Tax=Streptomyces fulvorobeus TaxID=284028 RepID=A0A7J0C003_9ACTN|nr:hypothetical protein [Streptomyces fulvorobeus]GFM95294.1 hypothetical protein Sfulv_01050 [Streptomyces fulvorobeus]
MTGGRFRAGLAGAGVPLEAAAGFDAGQEPLVGSVVLAGVHEEGVGGLDGAQVFGVGVEVPLASLLGGEAGAKAMNGGKGVKPM